MSDFATFDDLNRFNLDLQKSVLLNEATRTKAGKTVFLSGSSAESVEIFRFRQLAKFMI